ncbi:hypothetical protein G9A89_017028 [Geosiphon pyriformis]|nr:hypothetical protein G9A89_017028 [Geosiphon pyriformis]
MEFMSNLGSNADIYRPSLFELIAQGKMHEMLQPAVKYILSVYAQRYPRYLLRIVNKHDEIYTFIMFFVERHYLKEWGASFAENFYGLKRIRSIQSSRKLTLTANEEKIVSLRNGDIWRSLLVLVGIPYAKGKLDTLYERVSGGAGARFLRRENTQRELINDERLPLSKRGLSAMRFMFKTLYPWVNGFYHLTILVFNIGYLFEKTPFYTPGFRLLGIEVRRMGAQDYREHLERKSAQLTSSNVEMTRLEVGKHILITILSRGFDFLKTLLPMSILFFKFLEWWYSSEYSRRPGGETGIEVPPPERIMPDPNGIPLPSTLNTCALCSNKLTNPTALPSGYVFCYTCIYRYVEDYGCCPITLIKADADSLRKVYNSAS